MKNFWILGLLVVNVLSAQQYSIYYKELRLCKIDNIGMIDYVGLQEQEDYEQIAQTLPDQDKLQRYSFNSVVRVNNEKSLYYPLDSLGSDSYDNKYFIAKDSLQLRSRIIANRNYNIIYLDLLKKQKISTEVINDKKFLIHERLPEFNWISDDSTRVINNFNCKVALLDPIKCDCSSVHHRHYKEVWYTEEIPSNIGPMGYWGLPGLVVEVLTNDYHIYFDRISYSLDGVEIVPPANGKKIERFLLENNLMFDSTEN